MEILIANNWQDYELIDSGNSQRLERFGPHTIVRPDPQAIWQPKLSKSEWEKSDAFFEKGKAGEGKWRVVRKIPEQWLIKYKDLSFWARLTPFKHTGIFPEQSVQWDWIREKIDNQPDTKVLNLFGYTGIASLACAASNATVTHVDASKPAIGWARENQAASGLDSKPIRWILDDALKFTARDIRREVKYDGIIMDPPVYGHGPEGEVWDFNISFPELLANCKALLSEKPLFVLVNAYAISSSSLMLQNILSDAFPEGTIEVGELALQEAGEKRLLSTGIFGRVSFD